MRKLRFREIKELAQVTEKGASDGTRVTTLWFLVVSVFGALRLIICFGGGLGVKDYRNPSGWHLRLQSSILGPYEILSALEEAGSLAWSLNAFHSTRMGN